MITKTGRVLITDKPRRRNEPGLEFPLSSASRLQFRWPSFPTPLGRSIFLVAEAEAEPERPRQACRTC